MKLGIICLVVGLMGFCCFLHAETIDKSMLMCRFAYLQAAAPTKSYHENEVVEAALVFLANDYLNTRCSEDMSNRVKGMKIGFPSNKKCTAKCETHNEKLSSLCQLSDCSSNGGQSTCAGATCDNATDYYFSYLTCLTGCEN